jgi:hypothetical protein
MLEKGGVRELTAIHFVPRVGTARPYVLETTHQLAHSSRPSSLRRKLLQPFAEGCVQGRVARPRYKSCLLEHALFSTESNLSHILPVCTILVCIGNLMKQQKENRSHVGLNRRPLDIAAHADATEGIRQGLEDARKSRVRPAKEFFAEFEARHGLSH